MLLFLLIQKSLFGNPRKHSAHQNVSNSLMSASFLATLWVASSHQVHYRRLILGVPLLPCKPNKPNAAYGLLLFLLCAEPPIRNKSNIHNLSTQIVCGSNTFCQILFRYLTSLIHLNKEWKFWKGEELREKEKWTLCTQTHRNRRSKKEREREFEEESLKKEKAREQRKCWKRRTRKLEKERSKRARVHRRSRMAKERDAVSKILHFLRISKLIVARNENSWREFYERIRRREPYERIIGENLFGKPIPPAI